MRGRKKDSATEWEIKRGRQGKYDALEKLKTCPKATWWFKHPIYGIRHPNEDGRLSEKENDCE